MFKRIASTWWAVPLLSAAVLALNACRPTLAGVAAGLLLVPVWLAAVVLCRRRWNVARTWRHWLAGGAVELLHIGWCVVVFMLYSAAILSKPLARDSFAEGVTVPQDVAFLSPQDDATQVAPPGVHISGAEGVYRVELLLPQDASSEGAFMVHAEEYTTGKVMDTDPMVCRISAADRAAARDGVIEIAFPHIRVYSGDEGQFYGSRWQIIFLPDRGEPEQVSEDLYLIEGLSLNSPGASR